MQCNSSASTNAIFVWPDVEKSTKNAGVPHVWETFVVNNCGKGRELLENEPRPWQQNANTLLKTRQQNGKMAMKTQRRTK